VAEQLTANQFHPKRGTGCESPPPATNYFLFSYRPLLLETPIHLSQIIRSSPCAARDGSALR